MDQPWVLEPGYLDGLSAGATVFWERWRATFGPQIRAKLAGETLGYTSHAEQFYAHVAAAVPRL